MRLKVPLIRKQIIGENLVYSGIWAVVYLIPIMNSTLMSEAQIDFSKVFLAWGKITPYFILFLLNNQLFIRFQLNRGRISWYLLTCLLVICGTFGAIEVYEQWRIAVIGDYAGEPIMPRHASLTDLRWYWNIVLGVFMFLANVGIKKLYESMQADEDKERLARESVEAEMYYLKYQINPHFLMNTLNNIHALIDIDADSAKRGLIELSDMMRHVVYESSADEIPLRKDVEFIKNYIELMRIRYSQDIDIIFNYPQNCSAAITLPPLIFIVFVENAFKHGVSRHHSSYIHIDIIIEDGMIVGKFVNSVHQTTGSGHSSGIGLDNVRRRLKHIYGKRCYFDIESAEDKYSVILKIPIDNEKS